MARAAVPIAVLVVAAAWVLRYALEAPPAPRLPACEAFPALCAIERAAPPAPRQAAGRAPKQEPAAVPIGRWTKPRADISDVPAQGSALERFFGLKGWSYVSVSSPRFFVALTPVQFNYVEDVYLSVVDKALGQVVFEYHWQMPFGRSLRLPPASVDGCMTFADGWTGAVRTELCFVHDHWLWTIDAPDLKARITIEKGEEALILTYPLAGASTRPAYVHKEAGMRANGFVDLVRRGDREEFAAGQGTGVLDWTRAWALRETRWRWTSLSAPTVAVTETSASGEARSRKAAVGINLSSFVYDVTANGGNATFSSENALWIDHVVFPLNAAARIEMPGDGPLAGPWKITLSEPGVADLRLTFKPHGLREDHTHLGLVVSDFVQPFGSFSGSISLALPDGVRADLAIVDAYGVCEDHRAVW